MHLSSAEYLLRSARVSAELQTRLLNRDLAPIVTQRRRKRRGGDGGGSGGWGGGGAGPVTIRGRWRRRLWPRGRQTCYEDLCAAGGGKCADALYRLWWWLYKAYCSALNSHILSNSFVGSYVL